MSGWPVVLTFVLELRAAGAHHRGHEFSSQIDDSQLFTRFSLKSTMIFKEEGLPQFIIPSYSEVILSRFRHSFSRHSRHSVFPLIVRRVRASR